jgi:DNA-binding beta-propeller fold protein YncE
VVPTELAVVPAGADGPDGLGGLPHLLCACGAPDPARVGRDGVFDAVSSWRVLDLDADTLEPVASYTVTAQPHALQAAPDGGAAYALVGGLDVGSRADLVHLDLRGAGPRTLAELPGRAAGLAVAGQYVYVPYPDGHVVWAVDRLRGRVVEALPVGRRPLAVAVSVAT